MQSLLALQAQCQLMNINTEANVHSDDWLMIVFVIEFGIARPWWQSTRSVCAALRKEYERDSSLIVVLIAMFMGAFFALERSAL